MQEQVVLVDEQDNQVGLEEKIKAHEKALLHRAFSVILFRKRGNEIQTLLQQRNIEKYHSGGLWTNACCSHPRDKEEVITAGRRRLQEELGIDVDLEYMGNFVYKFAFDNGLTEHEFDHVLCGIFDKELEMSHVNKEEVQAVKWVNIENIQNNLQDTPGLYTAWFGKAFDIAIKNFNFDKL